MCEVEKELKGNQHAAEVRMPKNSQYPNFVFSWSPDDGYLLI